jgi:deoxyribodipyrimidine photo-lyase
MNQKRVRVLNDAPAKKGPAVYWMSRDQRVEDNWALVYAQKKAISAKKPLGVAFCLVPEFLNASFRQYTFMLEGLKEVCERLSEKNIPFFILIGKPEAAIADFVQSREIGVLVADFDPLRIKREWKQALQKQLNIPFYEVDSRNIVPCWHASEKQEYGAYTIRPKIHRLLGEFLDDFPKIIRHPYRWEESTEDPDWQKAAASLRAGKSVQPVGWIQPGEESAQAALERFIQNGLRSYTEARNDPTKNVQSNLSPFLHFGHISSQRIAIRIRSADVAQEQKEAFLEELIVRRELSDNFCYYNPRYDSTACFPRWARESLRLHEGDKRPYLYTLAKLENAATHDPLWNAAQKEMVVRGKMHGYMRMYWAKKILEWTENADQAMEYAIFLNDRYELDGRETSGYAGIAWSLGGIHDRAWFERPVFGKVRYMSYNGCRKKFDVDEYIRQVEAFNTLSQ